MKEIPLYLSTQFKNPEVFTFNGKAIEVVDLQPNIPKTETPVVLAPGWSATPETHKQSILTLAELGRRTISIKSYHGIKANKIENLPDAELRKTAAVIKVLNQKEIEKADFIGHSEAGVYLTIAATLYPEKFRNIVLVNPAGLIGKDNVVSLSLRLSADILQEIINSFQNQHHIEPILVSFKEAIKSIASNPLQSLKEGIAASNSQIQQQLENLKEKGIGISIIHAGKDILFPMDRVQEIVNTNQLHGFYSTVGTHSQFFLDFQRFTIAADEVLTALENRTK